MPKTNLLYLLFIICLKLPAQNFSYTHYGLKEGLAGSNVYAATQDNEGFIWFATETGVSRFDGVHFKNFTIDDGLPDNEILNLFCDSKGRLWMMPFRKTISYYHKGKLYTQKNDKLLAHLQLTGNILFMAEDKQGNIALSEAYKIHFIRDKQDTVLNIPQNDSHVNTLATDRSGNIMVSTRTSLYRMSGGHLNLSYNAENSFDVNQVELNRSLFVSKKTDLIVVRTHAGKIIHTINSPENLVSFSFLSDSVYSVNTQNGSFIYSIHSSAPLQHYLKGRTVTDVFRDTEGNLWFCTNREGVYKLNSPHVSNQFFTSKNGKFLSVHSLCKFEDKLWVGAEDGYLFTTSIASGNVRTEPHTQKMSSFRRNQTRVLLETRNKELLIGTESHIVTSLTTKITPAGALKDITPAFGDHVLVSTSSGVWLINTSVIKEANFDTIKAIWNERATTAHYSNGIFYIGTLDGLYELTEDGKITLPEKTEPLLKSRIAAMRETEDGILWLATYDRGIVGYKNKKVIFNITKDDGLSSNICRNLFLRHDELWVGTDNGLNRITIDGKKFNITKYSVADGLLSNFINAICIDDSLVYVGTPEGISYFDDKKISQKAACLLRLTNIIISGKTVASDSSNLILPRKSNNIRFEYAGISYRSGGEIYYRYRLSGLDTAWRTTKENFLDYPTLLPGDYVMELQAINKFGTKSEIIAFPFTIKKFWWEKVWVQVGAIALFLLALGLVTNRRIRQIKSREEEKNLLREKISMLEQMALKAQMNPHFIFNSLNSIQHYVLDKDILGANKYISGFSSLIRQTLDNSSKPEISIEEEIKYLSQYLELEKMRTGNGFSYSISISDETVHNGHTISPMVLQPFVENSIRHGIRYRNDSNGHIKIEVIEYEKGLKFTIEDNGVGRAAAAVFKSKNPIEYQSKGIALTEERISMMNKNRKQKIEVTLADVEDNGTIRGTKVAIVYPHS